MADSELLRKRARPAASPAASPDAYPARAGFVPASDLLTALGPADRKLIEPQLETVTLTAGDMVYQPGDIVSHCYFPTGPAMCAYFVELPDGAEVETFLVGREGALGGIVSAGNLPAYARATVIQSGYFLRIELTRLHEIKSRSPAVARLFECYADCVMAQVFQSIACNAVHTVEQRAAKWLSSAVERIGRDDVTITQEQLASMMGVGRSYASRVLQRFKREGILRTRRGGIVVLERGRLQAHACACNEQVSAHFQHVLGAVYPGSG